MNLSNVKNGKGFVTQDELRGRMCHFRPPTGEAYFIHRLNGDFSQIGITYAKNDVDEAAYRLFKIFTGNRELYVYICDLIRAIAEEFYAEVICDLWSEDESDSSEKTTEGTAVVGGGGDQSCCIM